MLTIPRPPPTKTNQWERGQAYLIYKGKIPYTCRVKDKTTLVVFHHKEYAHFIRMFLETHFVQYNTWPNMVETSFGKAYDHGLLDVEPIDPYSIFDMCLRLNVNACVVDEISETDNKVTVNCEIIEVEPRADTYRHVLEELISVE